MKPQKPELISTATSDRFDDLSVVHSQLSCGRSCYISVDMLE
ncbi:hypothetical protein EGR_10773 [Echinococcus granulosus]|uniref:Uncharacterized protein n=1 Tax=Echinococcus granulosus TaxID=6210 RepID=W6U025_ECHGR|nr:hypothetical protein EGR_10773 [Echinococcus granulosus]EUB54363.1 hypothetical protein EGR_10773 [Echinococcus granulosus]